MADGNCAQCPLYQKAIQKKGNDFKSCGQDDCTDKQIVTVDGSCRDCENYTKPSELKRMCLKPTCKANQKITLEG